VVTVALVLVLLAAVVAAAHAAQKLVAGQFAGGGGGGSGGGMKLTGSIPASAAGRSSGGAYRLTGGFVAAAQTWRDSASAADQAAAAGRGTITSLSAVPAGSGAEIIVSLSAAASVEVRVLNIAGRPIRVVTSGLDCQAGLNTLTWSGLSDAGLQAPNGRYLIEVRARTASGDESRALAICRVER
jgi:hypothetical protein